MIGNVGVAGAILVWTVVAGIGLRALGKYLAKTWEIRRIYKYRWSCREEGCTFQVRGEDPGIVAVIVDRHQTQGHQ